MNVRLLRRIQKRILREPRQFQMEAVFTNRLPLKIPHCGTAACIVGWGIALQNKLKPLVASKRLDSWGIRITDESAIFGLDRESSQRLVYFDEWPERFRKHTKEGTAAFARQAVRRIDHFIKTKGAE